MKDFEEIYYANREKICVLAEAGTKRNADGHTVILRNDPWFYEDEWDTYHEELKNCTKNSCSHTEY